MQGKPTRILFVCLGNICRSPAAEGVLRTIVDSCDDSANWVIDSAGTGNYHVGDLPDRRMREAAWHRGLRLEHICRQVREADFDNFDLIIGMDESNVANLRRLAPTAEAESKIHRIDQWFDPGCGYSYVPDPYYEGPEGFKLVLDLLDQACNNIYNQFSE